MYSVAMGVLCLCIQCPYTLYMYMYVCVCVRMLLPFLLTIDLYMWLINYSREGGGKLLEHPHTVPPPYDSIYTCTYMYVHRC